VFTLNGPVVLDVVVNHQELAVPPKTNFELAHGFTMWMLKAVLNGRGKKISSWRKLSSYCNMKEAEKNIQLN